MAPLCGLRLCVARVQRHEDGASEAGEFWILKQFGAPPSSSVIFFYHLSKVYIVSVFSEGK